MSYTPSSQGPFIVGILNTTVSNVGSTEVTINYNEFRTSRGLLTTTPPTVSGLAFTDVTSESGQGTNPYGEHCPKTGGGYGCDIARKKGRRGASGAVGCAVYSNDTYAFRYHAYDNNNLISNSHGYIL